MNQPFIFRANGNNLIHHREFYNILCHYHTAKNKSRNDLLQKYGVSNFDIFFGYYNKIYLLSKLNPNFIQAFFNACNKCDCCSRHQINKPLSLVARMNYPYIYSNSHHDCECICRQNARMCVRAKKMRIKRSLIKYINEKQFN